MAGTAWHAANDESSSDGGTPPQRARRGGAPGGGARCAARPTRLGVLSLAQSLEPGETKDVTLWVRGEKVGRQVMRFLFAYEAEVRARSAATRALTSVAWAEPAQGPALSV